MLEDVKEGSIPACAGETSEASSANATVRVYPRVRGGNQGRGSLVRPKAGLSPRARGKHSAGVH